MIAIGVSGALGRIGSAIIDLALVSKDFKVRAVFERPTNRGIGKPFKEGLVLRKTDKASLAGVKVLIDFTEPSATLSNLSMAADAGCGMVIGTTGMSDAEVKKIEKKPIAVRISVTIINIFKLIQVNRNLRTKRILEHRFSLPSACQCMK